MWALGGLSILLTACTSPGADAFSSVDIAEEVAAFLEEYLAAIDVRDTASNGQAYVDDERFAWIEDGEVRYRSS